jgi:hypothetical protein
MFHRSLLALSLTLLIGSSAYADTIFITPALIAPNGGLMHCQVVNGSTTKTITAMIQILDLNGDVVTGSLTAAQPLAVRVASSADDDARYCIVTLVSGPQTTVRVSISVTDSNGATVATLEGHP